ncbi:16S rRNA (guanine(527)-N(7))-methyltransferase RsmG [bacterium]|nr:16S rRNA (guanine(527)-N(7))-methyltransferase RsmG [bacterium]
MGDEDKRLREVLDGMGVQPASPLLDKLAEYLALVGQYSSALNLTGFGGDKGQLAGELVGEALRLWRLGEIPPVTHTVDLGSGNGSPVVPLAALCPEADFIAVESRERRVAFLRTVKAKLGLENLDVYEGRVEDLAKRKPTSFDLATSRAFAPPDKLLPLAAQLLVADGQLRGYLGGDASTLAANAGRFGFKIETYKAYTFSGSIRHVYLLTKRKPNPKN